MLSLSSVILSVLTPFAILFSKPVWHNSLTLLIGAILCRGKRTVCSALRVMGLSHENSFAKYHHVLNRVEWSPLHGSNLEPSKKRDEKAGRKHKTTLDWTVQMLRQIVRWLPNMPSVLVGDGGFACAELAWAALRLKVCLISRLKMNARLFDFPPIAPPGKQGRKRTKGVQLFGFKEMLEMPGLGWEDVITDGYDKKRKKLRYITNTCLWGELMAFIQYQ